MTLIISLVIVVTLVVYIVMALKYPDSPIERVGRVLFVVCQCGVFVLLFIDCLRGSVDKTPVDLAQEGYPLIALPGLLGFLHLSLLAMRGWDTVWTLFALSVVSFVTYIPVLMTVEMSIHSAGMLISFLDPGPMTGMLLVMASPFLIAPAVAVKIPKVDSRLWQIAYMRRIELLKGIEALALERGWDYSGPRTILEAGSTSGAYRGYDVQISTEATFLPFAYGVRVAIGPDMGSVGELHSETLPDLSDQPWFGPQVELSRMNGAAIFTYYSTVSIPLGVTDLRLVIQRLTLEEPTD